MVKNNGIRLEATDEIHQKLWQRKKLNKRREQNDQKRVRKNYYKEKEAVALEDKSKDEVTDKHQQFYQTLFKKDEGEIVKPSKPTKTFNKALDRLKVKKE